MPMPQRPFDVIYHDAPPAAVGRLLAFRERCAVRNVDARGMIFPVYDMGEGERAVVFLPGSMGNGEIYFPFLLALHGAVRVIALSYPAARSFDDIAAGAHDVLEALGIKEYALIGQSVGGLIAQLMLRQKPGSVKGAALFMTGAPAADLPSAVRRRWTGRWRSALRFHTAPFDSLRRSMAMNVFTRFCPQEWQEHMVFWEAFIEETFQNAVYKKQYLSINMYCIARLYRRHRFTPSDTEGWPGAVTVFTSQGDASFAGAEQDCLARLYPGAELVDMGTAGQFTPQIDEAGTLKHFEAFLARVQWSEADG